MSTASCVAIAAILPRGQGLSASETLPPEPLLLFLRLGLAAGRMDPIHLCVGLRRFPPGNRFLPLFFTPLLVLLPEEQRKGYFSAHNQQ